MHFSATSVFFLLTTLLPSTTQASYATSTALTYPTSPKRGLVFVPSKNANYAYDNQVWTPPKTDLTWYYNYGVSPSPAYSNLSQSEFQFIPMLWSPTTTFLSSITSQINAGTNISHILTYNEPDGDTSTGGSNVSPSVAATNWISQVEPLRKLGVKVGAPAVTGGSGGFTWLASFFDACAAQGTNCTADFFPIHWYGNFEGLASHIGQVVGTYPNKTIWITEYALSDAGLTDTQSFFNSTCDYFDRIDYIERYSYFGSFRSDVSNVGVNAAMLDGKGRLTDIGSWYLGGRETGVVPSSSGAWRGMGVGGGCWSVFVVGLVLWL